MGLFTFRALQLGAKHVYCYEPNPQNFELLQRNVEANAVAIGGRVTLHNEAVDATGGGDKPLFLAHRLHRQGQVGFPPLFLRFSIGKCRNRPLFRAFE